MDMLEELAMILVQSGKFHVKPITKSKDHPKFSVLETEPGQNQAHVSKTAVKLHLR